MKISYSIQPLRISVAVFTTISFQISRRGGFENGSGENWLRVRWGTGRGIEEKTWRFLNSTRLIHCDYNLKNILIRQIGSVWKVAGVLDWEFAIAGSPLVDIGNFLRFEDELPPGFSGSFIKGYLSSSTGLPG